MVQGHGGILQMAQRNFRKNQSGATAIEYGLIAALIAVGIIAAATTLGDSLTKLFNSHQPTQQETSK